MTFYGSVTIALAIFLSSVVLAAGGRYQIVPDGVEYGKAAWKIDRVTGRVQFCETVQRPLSSIPTSDSKSENTPSDPLASLDDITIVKASNCN